MTQFPCTTIVIPIISYSRLKHYHVNTLTDELAVKTVLIRVRLNHMETWINLVFAAVCDQCNCTTAFSQLCATLSSSLAAHKHIRDPSDPCGRLPRRHCSAYMLSVIMWAPYVECCLNVNAVVAWKSAKPSFWMVPLRLIGAESGVILSVPALGSGNRKTACVGGVGGTRLQNGGAAQHGNPFLNSVWIKTCLYTCVDNSCI